METGSIHRHIPTVYTLTIMGSVGFHQVSIAVSVILAEKIALHVVLFFLSKRRNYRTEAMIGTPDGSVN